jgi:phospholipase C
MRRCERIDQRRRCTRVGAFVAAIVTVALGVAPDALASGRTHHVGAAARQWRRMSADGRITATPIKHLVVVFQENRSFDRYFGTYPYALNPPGEPRFVPAPDTPTVNGLTPALLTHNPNSANPVRLGPDVGNTCGSNHSYLAEQTAFDNGLMDRFVEETGPTVRRATGPRSWTTTTATRSPRSGITLSTSR